jgi:hypothetical protein
VIRLDFLMRSSGTESASMTHPAGSDPFFHDSVNLLTVSVKIRSKFIGSSEKFPREEHSDEFRGSRWRGG